MAKLTCLLALCALVVIDATFVPGYHKGTSDGKYYFKFQTEGRTWYEQSLKCQSENGQLAVPTSQKEMDWYIEEIKKASETSADFNTESIALGFHQRPNADGPFKAWDGTPLSETGYEKWAPGQPSNSNGNEHCGAMFKTGLYNDIPCDLKVMAMCKSTWPEAKWPKPLDCIKYEHNYNSSDLPEAKFYKLHLEPKKWEDAKAVCASEGAKLVEINSQAEADLYKEEIDMHPSSTIPGTFNKDIFLIGFNDREKEGHYVYDDGKTLEEAGYATWSPSQPDNWNGNENCGSLHRNGKLNDVTCDEAMMFICEKHEAGCEETRSGYKRSPMDWSDSIYRFETKTPLTWDDALLQCQSEDGSLAIIQSEAEAKRVVEIMEMYPEDTITAPIVNKNFAMVGFHDRFVKGHYQTIPGVPLEQSGYAKWSPGQPSGGVENCASMFRTGLYNDVSCDIPYLYICERASRFSHVIS